MCMYVLYKCIHPPTPTNTHQHPPQHPPAHTTPTTPTTTPTKWHCKCSAINIIQQLASWYSHSTCSLIFCLLFIKYLPSKGFVTGVAHFKGFIQTPDLFQLQGGDHDGTLEDSTEGVGEEVVGEAGRVVVYVYKYIHSTQHNTNSPTSCTTCSHPTCSHPSHTV